MPTWLYLVIIGLFLVAIAWASMREWRRYPDRACRKCGGSGRAYQPGKGKKFSGDCRACGRRGTRTRAGVRFLDGRRDER